jgi:hypothetical protein
MGMWGLTVQWWWWGGGVVAARAQSWMAAVQPIAGSSRVHRNAHHLDCCAVLLHDVVYLGANGTYGAAVACVALCQLAVYQARCANCVGINRNAGHGTRTCSVCLICF